MLEMKTEKQIKFDSTYTRGSKKISAFRQFSIHNSSKISRYDFCVYTSFTIVSHSPFVLENKFWGGNRKLKFWMERSNLKIDNEKFRTYNSTHFTQIFLNQTETLHTQSNSGSPRPFLKICSRLLKGLYVGGRS